MNEHDIRILITEDNPDTLELLKRKLQSRKFYCQTAPNVPAAIKILEHEHIDIVLTDYKMPKISGLDLIRHISAHFPHIRVIMITGFPSIEGAVEAVKKGAYNYITKPFTDDELFAAIQEAINGIKLSSANRMNSDNAFEQYGLIGNSPAMQKVYHSIKKSSGNKATVLIQGESGTGKELVARAIHYYGSNSKAPFVPVNCGAIPESLLEAELFGYRKGSFTGAAETRPGYFITADGGTIFLDEISETSLSMQVKLLRVLQDKHVMMIGSNQTRKVNVRIIAATNKDLVDCIKRGTFRQDLYYRLHVFPIIVPPLREHPEDIPDLIHHFIGKFAHETGQKSPVFSDEALEAMVNHSWQGNVRELENLIYQLLMMNDSTTIKVSDLPDYMKFSINSKSDYNRSLAEVERDYILDLLNLVKGNKSRAARILGIDRKTLYSKLNHINPDR